MKIIKRVELVPWSVKVKCSSCKSNLEVEAGDLIIVNVGCPRDPSDMDPRAFFTCPVCNSQDNSLRRKDIPDRVWQGLSRI